MEYLKKILALALCTVMLAGCASSDESGIDDTGDSAASDEVSEIEGETVPSDADGTMLYQSDRANIRFVREVHDEFNYSLVLEIENLTDDRFMVGANDIAVNGVMIDPFLYAIAEAGETTEAAMEFMIYNLERSGISELGTVEFSFFITDGLSEEGLESSESITLELRDAAEPEKPEGTEIYNKNGLEVIYTGMLPSESTNGSASFYVNNATGKDIDVDIINVKIDGVDVYAEMYYPISAGKSRVCDMYFWDEAVLLEDSKTLEFELGAIHPETYEPYIETGNLEVDLQSTQN
ncbi:MAG: hypothetical protein IJY74_03650 [Oscillospiraceae bacterium]|nr:hypothetical protein [Oscillospiraceae bacterium]